MYQLNIPMPLVRVFKKERFRIGLATKQRILRVITLDYAIKLRQSFRKITCILLQIHGISAIFLVIYSSKKGSSV